MPSRFEQYKTDESQKRELQSDLTELQTLYNSYGDFYNKYTFDEFLEYATKNSNSSLDKSIENSNLSWKNIQAHKLLNELGIKSIDILSCSQIFRQLNSGNIK